MKYVISKVLVAGVSLLAFFEQPHTNVSQPNGILGRAVAWNLEKADFTVTLLTRDVVKTRTAFPGFKAIQSNYRSVEELVHTLRSECGAQDALVILINRDQTDAQIRLMKAASEAGIAHIIPSAFGIGTRDPFIRSLPVLQSKVMMEDFVVQEAEAGKFTFTGIQTGAFLDYALAEGILFNTEGTEKATPIYDLGDTSFSATIISDIGKATAAALTKFDEFRNRWIFVHSAVITQNQILTYARASCPTRNFHTFKLSTAEMAQEAWARYKSGERSLEVTRLFTPLSRFAYGLGLFQETQNNILGIRLCTEDDLRALVARYANPQDV